MDLKNGDLRPGVDGIAEILPQIGHRARNFAGGKRLPRSQADGLLVTYRERGSVYPSLRDTGDIVNQL